MCMYVGDFALYSFCKVKTEEPWPYLGCRLLYLEFLSSQIKDNRFVLNSSEILNNRYEHDIRYHPLSTPVFKKILQNNLLFVQNLSLIGDNNWLPCYHGLFSNIAIF